MKIIIRETNENGEDVGMPIMVQTDNEVNFIQKSCWIELQERRSPGEYVVIGRVMKGWKATVVF